jgi:hypothetical protein
MNMSSMNVWLQDLGGNYQNNYIYTVNVSVGTPPQYSQFIVSFASPFTFVFSNTLNSSLMDNPDAFYNASNSST